MTAAAVRPGSRVRLLGPAHRSPAVTDPLPGPLGRPVVRYGLVYPVPTLVVLFLASSLVGVNYGDLVFLLSLPVAVLWLAVGLGGRRLAAALPTFELLFGTASAYGEDAPEGGAEFTRGAAVIVYLTGVVIIGWVGLLANLLYFG